MSPKQKLLAVPTLFLLASLAAPGVSAQDVKVDREVGIQILEGVSSRIQKEYYDPNLRGVNWDQLYHETEQRIRQARSAQEIAWHIYMLVRALGDSHTVFVPPPTAIRYEYGTKLKFYGEHLYVDEVEKKSSAEKGGLKVGDRVVSILLWGQPVVFSGAKKARPNEELVLLLALHLAAPPELGFRVLSPGEQTPRFLTIQGTEKTRPIFKDMRSPVNIWEAVRALEGEKSVFEFGGLSPNRSASSAPAEEKAPLADASRRRIGYLKMPNFFFDKSFGKRLIKELTEYEALVIDLRGNPGGRVDTLSAFVGFFETEPVEIGQEIGRDKTEPFLAKPQKPYFPGPLVVLVDSESASSAEVFARHFQRQGRAKVVGDHSSGAVVIAKANPQRVGAQYTYNYLIQVSVAQLVLPDGENLEGKGVTPDYLVIPSGEDLAENRDPMLRKAAEVALEMLNPKEKPAASEK